MPTPARHDRRKLDQVKPSSSTVASTAGGALSVVVLWIVESFTGPIPAPVSASIATLVAIGAGYVFLGGRSVDTQD